MLMTIEVNFILYRFLVAFYETETHALAFNKELLKT